MASTPSSSPDDRPELNRDAVSRRRNVNRPRRVPARSSSVNTVNPNHPTVAYIAFRVDPDRMGDVPETTSDGHALYPGAKGVVFCQYPEKMATFIAELRTWKQEDPDPSSTLVVPVWASWQTRTARVEPSRPDEIKAASSNGRSIMWWNFPAVETITASSHQRYDAADPPSAFDLYQRLVAIGVIEKDLLSAAGQRLGGVVADWKAWVYAELTAIGSLAEQQDMPEVARETAARANALLAVPGQWESLLDMLEEVVERTAPFRLGQLPDLEAQSRSERDERLMEYALPWALEHGSDRLKMIAEEGWLRQSLAVFRDEWLAEEFPNWRWYLPHSEEDLARFDESDRYDLFLEVTEPVAPPERVLNTLRRIRDAFGPETTLRHVHYGHADFEEDSHQSWAIRSTLLGRPVWLLEDRFADEVTRLDQFKPTDIASESADEANSVSDVIARWRDRVTDPDRRSTSLLAGISQLGKAEGMRYLSIERTLAEERSAFVQVEEALEVAHARLEELEALDVEADDPGHNDNRRRIEEARQEIASLQAVRNRLAHGLSTLALERDTSERAMKASLLHQYGDQIAIDLGDLRLGQMRIDLNGKDTPED